MKYILGIDFGHGETAASYICVPETGELQGPQCVRIKRTATRSDYKIASVIRRDKVGKWELNSGERLFLSFKDRIESLTEEERDAFRAFIKKVYTEILSNNSFFKQEGVTIDLYIACPTKWDSRDKENYKKFVEEAIGHSVSWVINESDAAYFARRNKDVQDKEAVLVIDYGSSTIDYTLMVDRKKVDIDRFSSRWGAELIEQTLLNKYRNEENYKEVKVFFDNELRRTENECVNIDAELKFEIRKAKEHAYTDGSPVIRGFRTFSELVPSKKDATQGDEPVFKFRFDIEKDFSSYKDNVIANFQEIKSVVEDRLERLGRRKLNKIILSGGASIMPWVGEELMKIFGDSLNLEEDADPSYVVSEGIVKYAAAQENCCRKIMAFLDQQDYLAIYRICDETATLESIKKIMPPVLSKYYQNPTDLTGNDLLTSLTVFFEKLIDDPEYIRSFKKIFNEQLSLKVDTILKETMSSVFNYKLQDKILIEIEEVPIVPFDSEGMVENLKNWIDHSADTFWQFNWDKQRDVSMRKQIADGCFNAACNIKLTYTSNTAQNIADYIKLKTMECAWEIFIEKQLFKTM